MVVVQLNLACLLMHFTCDSAITLNAIARQKNSVDFFFAHSAWKAKKAQKGVSGELD